MNNNIIGHIKSQIKTSLIKFGSKKYLLLALFVFILGFATAVIMTKDKNWWQGSTCSLGMQVNGTPEFYNYTFIIIGIMLALFSVIINPQVKILLKNGILTKVKADLLKFFYLIEIITLISVGAIPYGSADITNTVHIWLGFYAFINIGIIILFAFWFFKEFPKKLLVINYLLLIASSVLYFLGISSHILPYAVAEMLTIAVVIWWMGMVFIEIDKLSKN